MVIPVGIWASPLAHSSPWCLNQNQTDFRCLLLSLQPALFCSALLCTPAPALPILLCAQTKVISKHQSYAHLCSALSLWATPITCRRGASSVALVLVHVYNIIVYLCCQVYSSSQFETQHRKDQHAHTSHPLMIHLPLCPEFLRLFFPLGSLLNSSVL